MSNNLTPLTPVVSLGYVRSLLDRIERLEAAARVVIQLDELRTRRDDGLLDCACAACNGRMLGATILTPGLHQANCPLLPLVRALAAS